MTIKLIPESDKCPPHNFHAAFVSDEKGGAVYCRWCGLILPLDAELSEAPAEESVMCPNCVTPWKCNGPHLVEQPRVHPPQ